MIMAGGSGTRLWPMSRKQRPKQLIPFLDGKSLLEVALDRLDGLVPPEQSYICAGSAHREVILDALNTLGEDQYLGEPTGRDTLNAVGFGAAVIGQQDPDAVIAVFTSDHLIEPVSQFQKVVDQGFHVAEANDHALVTFGVTPTHAATGFGYLKLGDATGSENETGATAFQVDQFVEKPNSEKAEKYFAAGPSKYLWNSGMFVWRAKALLDCIERYRPSTFAKLMTIADAWTTSGRDATLAGEYPTLEKISVDFAVMEPASRDENVDVVAIPMEVDWRDIGSWPSFAQTRAKDDNGNAIAASKTLLLDSKNCLVVAENPDHVIATIGCENLIIVNTAGATFVCHKDQVDQIKALHEQLGEKFGPTVL